MEATIKHDKKDATKRAYQSVPFDEMRRLMRVYGSLKCLRKRESVGGKGSMKVTSMKRKFYRWFPDLEERFVKDAAGFWRPKFGHEFEMRYRQDMRARDGEILARKRNRKRKQHLGVGKVPKAANPNTREATASAITSDATIAPASDSALVSPVSFRDIDLKLEPDIDRSASIPIIADTERHTGCASVSLVPPSVLKSRSDQEPTRVEDADIRDGLLTDAASIIADAEPLDGSFATELGIFDDAEESFYGCPPLPLARDSPGLRSSSSHGDASADEGPRPGASQEGFPSVDRDIDDMLDKSMEEYCEEVLASDGIDGGVGFCFENGML